MKIDCTIDGKALSLSINSNKPLSLILEEDIQNTSISSHCSGRMCGLCVVLMDGKAVLSCLVPAFEIRGKSIITFEGYAKTRNAKDIEKAYDLTHMRPCSSCYNSRTLIIESLLSSNLTSKEDIIREMEMLKCPCLEYKDIVKIVQAASEIRRQRHARRT